MRDTHRVCFIVKMYILVRALQVRRRVSPLAATAAWNLGRWDKMEMYADNMNEGDLLYREGSESHSVADGPFFKAVLAAHQCVD